MDEIKSEIKQNSIKKTVRRKRNPNSKDTLLNVAINLFNEKGYNNVSVDEICEKSGVTKGSFYHHFESKDKLLAAAYLESDKQVIYQIKEINKISGSLNQFKRIISIYANMVEFKGVDTMRQLIKSYLDNKDSLQWVIGFFNPEERPAIKMQLEIFKTGQLNGEIRNDIEPIDILRYFIPWLNGFVLDWCYHEGNYNFAEKMDKVSDMFLEYIKGPKIK